MPEWCSNTLLVTGDEKQLEKFKKIGNHTGDDIPENEKTHLLMANFFPELCYDKIPEISKETDNKLENMSDENKWKIENWGRKWDIIVEDFGFKDEKNKIQYQFQSPWSPPNKFIEEVSKDFPNLKFILTYEGEISEYGGKIIFTKGKIISKKEWEI